MIAYISIAISILASTAALLLMKILAGKIEITQGLKSFIYSFINIQAVLIVLLVVVSVIFNTIALSLMPLAFTYAFTSITMVLVVFGGHYLLKEELNKTHLIGIILIALGLILFHF